MWKCKRCGGTDFTEDNQTSIFDKEKTGEIFEDIKYTELYCSKCNNSGTSIKDIAKWED